MTHDFISGDALEPAPSDTKRLVRVWTDPADGRSYVIEGHGRLEEAEKAGLLPTAQPTTPEAAPIPEGLDWICFAAARPFAAFAEKEDAEEACRHYGEATPIHRSIAKMLRLV